MILTSTFGKCDLSDWMKDVQWEHYATESIVVFSLFVSTFIRFELFGGRTTWNSARAHSSSQTARSWAFESNFFLWPLDNHFCHRTQMCDFKLLFDLCRYRSKRLIDGWGAKKPDVEGVIFRNINKMGTKFRHLLVFRYFEMKRWSYVRAKVF